MLCDVMCIFIDIFDDVEIYIWDGKLLFDVEVQLRWCNMYGIQYRDLFGLEYFNVIWCLILNFMIF